MQVRTPILHGMDQLGGQDMCELEIPQVDFSILAGNHEEA